MLELKIQKHLVKCKSTENRKIQASAMNGIFSVNVLNYIKKHSKLSRFSRNTFRNKTKEVNCKQCGKTHEVKKCPACKRKFISCQRKIIEKNIHD